MAMRSSNSVGPISRSASFMPGLSNWKTPAESPRASISYVFSSSRGSWSISMHTPRVFSMIFERRLDDVEVAQAEEVHLEQAELGDVVHVELRDELGLALLLQRQVLGERLVADDHAGRVDGVVADEALEARARSTTSLTSSSES